MVVNGCDLLARRTPCGVEVCDEVGVGVEEGAEVEWCLNFCWHCDVGDVAFKIDRLDDIEVDFALNVIDIVA